MYALQMLHQNKDQVHQALENSPSWGGRARQHAGPASSSARPNPKQVSAPLPKKGQTQQPKSRLSKQPEPEAPQRQQRSKPKSQPQSPIRPATSPPINPAIQAKLQQVIHKFADATYWLCIEATHLHSMITDLQSQRQCCIACQMKVMSTGQVLASC